MGKYGGREPVVQSPASKRAKRRVQSKLSWFVTTRVNEIPMPSPPPSPAAVAKVVENGINFPEGSMGERKRKRNSRRKFLDRASKEENFCFFPVKQAHPFFSLHKATKKPTESRHVAGMQSRSWPELDGDYSVSLPPVHVFETLNDNIAMPDWRNWKFLETNSNNFSPCYNFENLSSLFEGSVEPLKMESTCTKGSNLDLLLLSHKKSDPAVGATKSSKLSNGLASKEQLSSLLEVVHVCSNFSLPPAYISSLDKQIQNGLHKRSNSRLASYHQRIDYFPDCRLWTDKYRPENSLEVCGNAESVKFLSEWLKSWHENGSVKNTNPSTVEDNGGASYNNEHNMDETCGGNTLKNMLLVTGPVGCGKTAAVYACALEQGFEVIEVNASSLRNGAYMWQTYGKAVDSLGLAHWVVKDQVQQTSKRTPEGLPDVADNGFQVDSSEVGSKICNQMMIYIEKKSASGQVANKILLFEEVDVVFDWDRGFISTILQLAETTKIPIILTSNDKKPVLQQLFDRLVVLNFEAPSFQELFCYVSMVCAFEKVRVSCNLLEHIINASLCDIRRILMLLQFWCQGMGDDTDHRIQCTKTSVQFDIDAVHLAIPKVIPWDFRCKLSEMLEDEINKTISMQHKLSSRENIDPWEMNNFSTAELRKKEELRRKHSLHDHKEFSHHMDILGDFFDDSDSPSLCNQRTLDQKHGIVLSSPSMDGLSADELKPTSAQPNAYNLPTSPTSLIPQRHGILPTGQIEKFRLDRKVENSFDSFEGASISHVCDTYMIQDVSCVPQSSLISVDETNPSAAVSSYNKELPSLFSSNFLPEVYITNSDKGIVGSTAAFYLESIQGNDDIADFPNEVEKYRLSQSQLMDDECSRAGFNVWSAPNDRIACSDQEAALVPETWRKLRSCRDKFKLFLSTNSKDASLVTSLISGLADLISETDIIYQSCNSILYESLEPTSALFVKTDSISCYDKQIEMGSTFAQHGLCLYMMKCATFGSSLGRNTMADFLL